jgi:hypothetical protein
VPANFEDQLAIVGELLREVDRMEQAERRRADASVRGYEQELRLAGLAQRIAQSYTIVEGVLAFVARRVDRRPVGGDDWHRVLISRCAAPFEKPARPALVSAELAEELRELCAFRHVVRNVYPTRLDPDKVNEHLRRLIRAARLFGNEFRGFASARAPRAAGRKRSTK